MNVGIVGSGLAGLSAACTLAARGHQVEVFEKNEWLGGKAAQLNAQGFRFDMGPTILIQPSVLRKVFAEAGRKVEDYIPMVRLDPQWRCFFENGSRIDLKDNAAEMAASLEAIWPRMGAGYLKFLEQSEQLHSISDRFFFWRSVGSMRDTMDVKGRVRPEGVARRHADASGQDRGAGDSRRHSRRQRSSDAGPLCAVCGVITGRFPGDLVRHRPYADGRGHLVSHGGDARCPGRFGKARTGAWRSVPRGGRCCAANALGASSWPRHRAGNNRGRLAPL